MRVGDIVFTGVNILPWQVTKVEGDYVTCKVEGKAPYFLREKKCHKSYWLRFPYLITVHDHTVYPIAEILASTEPEVRKEIFKILQTHDWTKLKYVRVNCDNCLTFNEGEIVQYNSLSSPAIALFECYQNGAVA